MRGSANLTAPSYQGALLGSDTPGNSLLATLDPLFGRLPTGPASGSTDPVAELEHAAASQAQQVALIAAKPEVQRDIAQFTRALMSAQTPAQLLANPTALKVLLVANGLGDQLGDTALATRALLSDPSQARSPVNQLADTRWLGVNKTYAFATKGLAMLSHREAIAEVAGGYAEALWRLGLNRTTPGLSNALDFLRRASTISNVGQVLGDPTFRAVITTTLGVPRMTAPAAREQAIAARIDLTQFSNPTFVNQFAHRYLMAEQRAARTSGGAVEPSVGLVV
jgi:hypothetical protein